MKRLLALWILLGFVLAGLAWPVPQRAPDKAEPTPAVGKETLNPPATAASDGKAEEAKVRKRLAELNGRLELLLREGKYAECQPVLEEILRLNGSDRGAWYNLACVQARLGQKDEAIRSLTRAVEKGYYDATHAAADSDLAGLKPLKGFGELLERMKKAAAEAERERTATERRLREKARKISTVNRRLFDLFKRKEYDKCEPLLREVLQIDPNNEVAWYNLACTHSRLGRKDQAVECLNKAVEHGYTGFRFMEQDEDLGPVRQTPGYKELLAREDEIQRERAEKIRDQLRERFGPDYLCGIDHDRKLIFATNVDEGVIEEMKERLSAYATAQWNDLFAHPFDRYLTVVIPKSSDWRYGPMVGGFYARGQHVLYARTVGMALIHEFTHALHGADQDAMGQQHPIWVTEGLATLFETSEVEAGHAVPQPNHRLNMLQQLVARKKTIGFRDFVKWDKPQFMRQAEIAYAQCRYMMVYLFHKGVLKKWYDAYTSGYEEDATGAKAMEEALGRKLEEIEKDWLKWVASLEAPALRLPPKHAYLGVQLMPGVDGVRIVRVVPGSGAHQAGLKLDDVIVKIDEERIIDVGELTNFVQGCKVGEKLRVRYRRGGEYEEVTVTLGAMPERVAPARPRPRPRRKATPEPATRPAASQPATRKAA